MIKKLVLLLVLCLTIGASAEGKVGFKFHKSKNPQLDAIRLRLEQNPYLVVIPLAFDKFLNLPRPLPVLFGELGTVNAFYSPGDHKILVGYEMYAYLVKTFRSAGYSQADSLAKADRALVFILLHELGHAVVGELDLPITGREEDCADEFATLMAGKTLGPIGKEIALAGAEFFGIVGSAKQLGDIAFWDEHSFDTQRFYSILCDIHAATDQGVPKIYDIVPRKRVQEAIARYPRKTINWMRQLSPHNAMGSQLTLLRAPATPTTEGHLQAELGIAKRPFCKSILTTLHKTRSHEKLVKDIDEGFLWPKDMTVFFTETGDATCRYNPQEGRLIISLDFMEKATQIIAANTKDPQELSQILGGVVSFTVTQELGRALIHELDLPWTGEPDDVSVEFVTLILSGSRSGQSSALAAARFYAMLTAEDRKLEDLNFWSSEPLNQQKFFDILGYLHSQDPVAFRFVEQHIPAHRRARYKRDYQLKEKRWKTLLSPYLQSMSF